jgi:hypothetical protein
MGYVTFPRNRKPEPSQILFDEVTAFLFTAEAFVKRHQAELAGEKNKSAKKLQGFRTRGETLLAAVSKLSQAEQRSFEKAHLVAGLNNLIAAIAAFSTSQASTPDNSEQPEPIEQAQEKTEAQEEQQAKVNTDS